MAMKEAGHQGEYIRRARRGRAARVDNLRATSSRQGPRSDTGTRSHSEKRKLMGGATVAEKERPAAEAGAESPKEKAASQKTASTKEKPPEKEKEAPPPPPPAAAQELTHINYYNEGNKLYLQNRVVEAVAMFQKCIKANNKYPNCHRSLGIAYAKLGQGDKASREYKIYLSLSPDAPDRKQLQAIIDDFEKGQK